MTEDGQLHAQHVDLPDGRRIWGRAPGGSAVTLDEHDLRDELARLVGGITEARLPYGVADVLTKQLVFEVEPAASWQDGVRQVLAYAMQTGLPPALALFGQADHLRVQRLYLKLRTGPPPVELWWHTGQRWQRIASLPDCTTMRWPGDTPGARPGYRGAR